MNNYYKASGKFSPISFIYFLLVALIALPILGLIYAYCIWYIPFPYINFFIAAGFGFLTGILVNSVVVGKGKVRNPALALTFGILGGLIGMYFHWAVWVDLVINAGESYGNSRIGVTVSNIKFLDVFILALNPVKLFELISEINQYGTWGIRGFVPSGVFLYIIWAIELVIVVFVATLLPHGRSKQPFCETSNEWYAEKELDAFSFIENPEKIKNALEKKESNVFESITKAENLEQDHSVFTLYTSKLNKNYLTIENKKAKTGSKGKIDFDSIEFVKYISIDSTLKDALIKE